MLKSKFVMEFKYIKVDAELADEYCEQYRKLFQSNEDEEMSNQQLLESFLEDRLQEELQFVNDEIDNLKPE